MRMRAAETLIEGFTAAITEAVGVAPEGIEMLKPQQEAYRPDAVMKLEHEGRAFHLVMEARRVLFPRDARDATRQLKSYLAYSDAGAGGSAVPVLMAEMISPGARQLLRDERVGYFDASGSLFLSGRGLYVRIEQPASTKQARSFDNLFVGRKAQVLRAVWLLGGEWFGVHQIAQLAGVSPGTTSETLISADRREWVETRGAGPSKERRLINPRALLDAWSAYQMSAKAQAKTKAIRHFYVPSTTPADLQRRVDQACALYGVSYELADITACQIHAPSLSSVSQVLCRIPIESDVQAMLASIDARPVREGWNLGIHEIEADPELRFRQRINDLWVCDPLQTYLDLVQAGGRAKELAQHLRAERLEVDGKASADRQLEPCDA